MSSTTPAPVVLIIGCGIAGPVFGILLKQKGYNPVVFEKVSELGDAGASLMLMSNGLKVLQLIGVAEHVSAESTPVQSLVESTSRGELLGSSDLPGSFRGKYGQPLAGIKRSSVNLTLKNTLLRRSIELREGWELSGIIEEQDSVTAYFSGDRSVTGSFLIGCDGIKSVTRRVLLEAKGITEGPPLYTGLTQVKLQSATAGISKTPEGLLTPAAMRNWYADGTHVIAYPISKTHVSWAITQRETNEAAETWRPYRREELAHQKRQLCGLLDEWNPAVAEMICAAERIIKFGLFDREELAASQWYSKRCVLVGDAAHPTSPHLGQGANQALEDCFHLCQALPDLVPGGESHQEAVVLLGPSLGESIFKPYAEKRQSRTAHLVKGAREIGEHRTASGETACRLRDDMIREKYIDESLLASRMDELLREPF
ncbi:hypothetical protein ED733_009007 [Metarhizium rileyi]|uniref:FAD-binding domain-containing protein n=1 Tax=Metarhizium rileyi (strain RCEF 4871) TaxID=1649241 RepID=A0A5C6GQC2_METRR|nr:hypothetical protein ED733_009007 [Metarhizium rileyi]